MKFPFVLRAHLEHANERIEELKQQLLELKDAHERIVDRVNFVNTGFHLHARFETKNEEAPARKPDPLNEQSARTETPADKFGPNARSQVRGLEAENLQSFEVKRREDAELAESLRQSKAAAAMNEALAQGDARAAQA